MECNKLGLGKGFLKVRAKVTGFLIAKIEKRNTPEQVIVTKKRNTISTTGLQYLLNAFQTYMSGVTYLGVNAPSTGIVITTSSGTQVTLSFLTPPAISLENNSIILSFTVRDDTTISYTATSEELITTSAGYNIPIATANLSITKKSDEILTMTWIITISVSTSGNITYLYNQSTFLGAVTCNGTAGGCSYCTESGANSEYPTSGTGCSLYGLSSQYPQTNFVTQYLFTDMFYNTYGAGPSNPFTQVIGTTLIIYTLYCLKYFFAGINTTTPNFVSYDPSNNVSCYSLGRTGGPLATAVGPIYLQVYVPSLTEPYIGVQIEFTT